MDLDIVTFKRLLKLSKKMNPSYSTAYSYGLRRCYHKSGFGDDTIIEKFKSSENTESVRGINDGLAGLPPSARAVGRPVSSGSELIAFRVSSEEYEALSYINSDSASLAAKQIITDHIKSLDFSKRVI